MRRPTLRPFNLGDLMTMVAAVAGGFALHRWVEAPFDRRSVAGASSVGYSSPFLSNWVELLWLGKPSYYAAAATLALVVARWRKPRPSAARVLRQPGAVACLAASLAIIYGFAVYQIQSGMHFKEPNDPPHLVKNSMAWVEAARWGSAAVAGAWAALALRGHWSPEPSWLDRSGRLLGLLWLIHTPVTLLLWPFLELYLGFPLPTGIDP